MKPMDGGAEVTPTTEWDELRQVLTEAQRRGLVGGGDLGLALAHARGFAGGMDGPPRRMLDLGSGAGLPGLVLALQWPDCEVTLLDGSLRSADFLTWAVCVLRLSERVRTLTLRAELAGRDPALRGTFAAVTSRGFGPPATTAECAAPLLAMDGVLVVSEPPGSYDDGGRVEVTNRWPVEGLIELGLRPERSWRAPYRYRSFRQTADCPTRFPRRVGVPRKRPLF